MYVFEERGQSNPQASSVEKLSSDAATQISYIPPVYEDPVAVFNRVLIEAYELGRRLTALEVKELAVAAIEDDWPKDFPFRSQLHRDIQLRLDGKFIGVERDVQENKRWQTLIPIAGGSAPVSTYPKIMAAIRESLSYYPKDRWRLLRKKPRVPKAHR